MRTNTIVLLLLLACANIAIPAAFASDTDESFISAEEEDEYEDPAEEPEDKAFLIAHKHLVDDKVVQGKNMTVSITVYNVGKGTAESVTVKDSLADPSNFDLIEGSLEQTFGSIDSGRKAELRYVLIPKTGNKGVQTAPAKIAYTSPGEKTATSLISTTPYIFVLSSRQNLELYLVKIGKYLSLGVLKTARDWVNSGLVIGIALFGVGGLTMFTSLSQSRAESRRKAAVRDLGLAE